MLYSDLSLIVCLHLGGKLAGYEIVCNVRPHLILQHPQIVIRRTIIGPDKYLSDVICVYFHGIYNIVNLIQAVK